VHLLLLLYPPTPCTYTLSLHDALPIFLAGVVGRPHVAGGVAYVAAVISEPGTIRHTAMDQLIFGELDGTKTPRLDALLDACRARSEEHTSELQSRGHLVCRLLLEKKKA